MVGSLWNRISEKKSQIAVDMMIHYDFEKPQLALMGMTPTQVAGFGFREWDELLMKALKEPK